MLTKAFATVAVSAAFIGLAAAPAQAAPATVHPVADSGSASGSADVLLFPIGVLKILICGIWGGTEPDPRPLCNGTGSWWGGVN
ncbi:hypothetical protein [Nocardia sp. IFM 10818]